MESRYFNRYQSFCSSLASLERAKARDPKDEFVISGTVQKFNLTFDISWKVMKDIITKYHKILDYATGSPRETLRMARSVNLITDDIWMEMLNVRHTLAHDYDGKKAEKYFPALIGPYLDAFIQLRDQALPYVRQINGSETRIL